MPWHALLCRRRVLWVVVAGVLACATTPPTVVTPAKPSSMRLGNVSALPFSPVSGTQSLLPTRRNIWVPLTPEFAHRMKPPGNGSFAMRRCDSFPEDCPVYMYFVLPHRNRVFSTRRLIKSLWFDLSGFAPLHPNCTCLVVSDYDDDVVGPTIDVALEAWPGVNLHHVRVRTSPKGGFDAGTARQIGLDASLTTPNNQTLFVTLDCDTFVLPGFVQMLLRFTWLGEAAFFPVLIWNSLILGKLDASACDIDTNIRHQGFGIFSIYVSDLRRVKGCAAPWQTHYGGEDIRFAEKVRQQLQLNRFFMPYLWHIQHPRAKHWTVSKNGLGTARHPFTVAWYSHEPHDWQGQAWLWGQRCAESLTLIGSSVSHSSWIRQYFRPPAKRSYFTGWWNRHNTGRLQHLEHPTVQQWPPGVTAWLYGPVLQEHAWMQREKNA